MFATDGVARQQAGKLLAIDWRRRQAGVIPWVLFYPSQPFFSPPPSFSFPLPLSAAHFAAGKWLALAAATIFFYFEFLLHSVRPALLVLGSDLIV